MPARAIPLTALAVATVLVIGCGGSAAPDLGAGSGPVPMAGAFGARFERVQRALETYWEGRLTGYTPPARTMVFEGRSADPSTYPTCGGQPVEAENAFFCPRDNTLIVDVQWARAEYARVGDAFLDVLLAHEYGHSAQRGLPVSERPPEADDEQQADCFAGSFWRWWSDSARREADGEREVRAALAKVTPGAGPGDEHGGVAVRVTAFEYGHDHGAEGCLDTAGYLR